VISDLGTLISLFANPHANLSYEIKKLEQGNKEMLISVYVNADSIYITILIIIYIVESK
jgi:hypothetical protein